MSSTTIRYSGVPENSHSRRFVSEAASDFAPDSAPDLAASGASAAAAEAAADFGLTTQADGFYDWAGRRLFLPDGSPDPMTSGVYRYQSSPDLCDLAAPESDPASPRYEPPHLRHQPGDDWEIGRKPYDPDDPGPFGTPGWRPDTRTGRHRRGELPDPLPPSGSDSDPSARPDPAPPEDSHPEPQPASSGSVPPWRPRLRTTAPPPEPPEGESTGSPRPITPDRPSPKPRTNSRFWSEADRTRSERTVNHQRRNHFEPDTDRFASESEPALASGSKLESGPEPFQFDKLREGAWDRFLVKSAELAAAHQRTHALLQREGGWAFVMIVVFIQWLVAAFKGAAEAEAPQADRTDHPHELGGTARKHRTAFAVRSTRLASAVRGAQRARIETGDAAGGAKLVGGAAWA